MQRIRVLPASWLPTRDFVPEVENQRDIPEKRWAGRLRWIAAGSALFWLVHSFAVRSLAGKKLTNRVIADFEVPNPITPAFLAERHVDFLVEAAQPNGVETGFRATAQFTAGSQESTSANAGGKRWTFCTVERPANATGNRQ
jgi:hypothetical protein